MLDKNNKIPEKLLDLSKEDFLVESVRQAQEAIQRCCCSSCGGEVILKKADKQNAEEIELTQFCTQCSSINCAMDKELYLNRMKLLFSSAARMV